MHAELADRALCAPNRPAEVWAVATTGSTGDLMDAGARERSARDANQPARTGVDKVGAALREHGHGYDRLTVLRGGNADASIARNPRCRGPVAAGPTHEPRSIGTTPGTSDVMVRQFGSAPLPRNTIRRTWVMRWTGRHKKPFPLLTRSSGHGVWDTGGERLPPQGWWPIPNLARHGPQTANARGDQFSGPPRPYAVAIEAVAWPDHVRLVRLGVQPGSGHGLSKSRDSMSPPRGGLCTGGGAAYGAGHATPSDMPHSQVCGTPLDRCLCGGYRSSGSSFRSGA